LGVQPTGSNTTPKAGGGTGWQGGGLGAGIAFVLAAMCWPAHTDGQSLSGGRRVMQEQFAKGEEYDYTPLRDAAHVKRFVELGLLVPVPGNADYRLHEVSFPYARPEVKLLIERLARQYRNACGEQLVVTSLTRPLNRQPPNSSRYSVHPRGMAVDLRRSNSRACRSWLEDVLLHLEASGTLDVTRERRPPHYHIAVYTREYATYVDRLTDSRSRTDNTRVANALAPANSSRPDVIRYTVRSGDSLWEIARTYGTTVDRLKSANNLRGSRIYAGQLLQVTPLTSR